LAVLFFTGPVLGATKEDLQDAIGGLQEAVDADVVQDAQVVEVINALVIKPLSITVGSVQAAKGTTADVPIVFKSGTTPVSTLQFDIQLPSGISFNSVTVGASASGAQKSAQSALINGGVRVLIFGLNQNQIATGVLVNMKLDVSSTSSSGKKTLPIVGIVGSDPAGGNVALVGTNGSISVQ
jgi:cohesin domain-containing protein